MVLLIITVSAASAAVLNVPADYATIQTGINASVAGDTVLVADGTYSGDGNVWLDFDGRPITVTSENGPEFCTIDCAQTARAIYFNHDETPATVFSGFTVINCWSNYSSGCAIRIRLASPTISNCVFRDNGLDYGNGTDGSALALDRSQSLIEDCIFENNYSDRWGGAIILGNSTATVTGCVFRNNVAQAGGAIAFYESHDIIGGNPGSANTFESNSALLGADLYYATEITAPVNAQHNVFTGIFQSDFYVLPQTAFDLTGSSSTTVPIETDVYVSPAGNDTNDGLTAGTAFLTIHHALSRILATGTNPLTIHLAAGEYSETATGESYPLPLLDYVTLSGDAILDNSHLNAEGKPHLFRDEFGIEMALKCLKLSYATDSAVHIENGSLTVENCDFQDNSGESGSGLHLAYGTEGNIIGSNFSNNVSNTGAGIYAAYNTTVDLLWCEFTSNDSREGAGIAVNAADANILGCSFESNHAENTGGAIWSWQTAVINISDSTFDFNTTGRDGGALYFQHSTSGLITNCTFLENDARSANPYGRGGAIWIDDTSELMSIDINTCSFIKNTADMGGAIYDGSSGGTRIMNSEFSENHALTGGAIAMESTLNIIGGTTENENIFTHNHAGAGADLFCRDMSGPVMNAQFNQFSGNILSDYFISPLDRFDLNGSTGQIQPVYHNMYISPDGDNNNSGATPEEPVQSITYALQRIASDETLPHTIYLAAGTYSRDATGENFPFPCLPHVLVKGFENAPAIIELNADDTGLVGVRDTNQMENIVIMNGTRGVVLFDNSDLILNQCRISNNTAAGYGAGIFSNRSLLTLNRCIISDNTSPDYGGGIFIFHNYGLEVIRAWECEFTGNTARFGGGMSQMRCSGIIANCSFINNTAGEGGGYHCSEWANPTVENCLFYNNSATEKAGAIFVQENSHPIFRYCTITGNSAGIIGGGMNSKFSYTDISHCIFWANIPDQIHMFEWEINAEYSIIQGGFEGEMIYDLDPLFVPGPLSDYYLSQTAAGDAEDSPALDTGKAPADTQFVYSPDGEIPLSEMTTRTDEVPDIGQVDIGVHFDTDIPAPTPTPTPELGVRIEIPSDDIHPGDLFYVHGYTINPGPDSYEDIPLVFVLDVYGLYYFWPGWQLFDPGDSSTFEYRIQTIPVGETFIEVYHAITWPETSGSSAHNLYFWGAMLAPDFSELFGQLDYFRFGFSP